MSNQFKEEHISKFIISLDCELLWGSHYIDGEKRFSYLQNGFVQFYQSLIELFEKYEVQATFAFVGAIAIDSKEFRKKVANSPTESPYKNWLKSILAKMTNLTTWHNPDILQLILSANQKHEIASHSFTHLRFDHIDGSLVAENELRVSHGILSKFCGKQIRTFIFPENRLGYLKEFKKTPYSLYRGRDDCWYVSMPFQRIFHFLDQMLPVAPRPVALQVDECGNYYVPGSLMLFAYDGIRKIIPDWLRYLKVKRGIDRAIAEKKIFHLWFHPWNLGSSPRMIRLLERILSYVSERRKQGDVTVVTMGELLPDGVR